jgi:hypothetical protein
MLAHRLGHVARHWFWPPHCVREIAADIHDTRGVVPRLLPG